jgi:hypothetical protein
MSVISTYGLRFSSAGKSVLIVFADTWILRLVVSCDRAGWNILMCTQNLGLLCVTS